VSRIRRIPMVHVLSALAVSVLLSVCSLVDAAPASASSSSAVTSQYWWPHNGCTNVPDNPVWPASFTYACNHHDGCYALRWSSSRATCDSWFFNDTRAECNSKWWMGASWMTLCYGAATTYYTGVRIFGQKYWDSSGTLTRISTPMNTA